jgi:DtxR family Mn-dependent transcriptional regulator
MYLRTLYELREEGIPPLRARLVERLHVSAPAASESTARLANDGLVALASDRTVQFTERGLARATVVMRKHRLAELLLTKVIGLDWALVHNEACRWEHVISDEVAARLTVILGNPERCPFGNPIPSGPTADAEYHPSAPMSLLTSADGGAAEDGVDASGREPVTVSWISERLQADEQAMRLLRDAGVVPGARLVPEPKGATVAVHAADGSVATEIDRRFAALVYVDT